MRALGAAVWGLVMGGCCSEPWRAFPEATPPDYSCSTGDVHGYDVYIWECLRGQRVVVAQRSAEMSCSEPVRQVVPCGSTAPLEVDLRLTPVSCRGARAGRGWR